MQITWQIEETDIVCVHDLLDRMKDNPFVVERIRVNIENPPGRVNHDDLWNVMVGCLLTTQQRSSPSSPVSRLINEIPFPLSLSYCLSEADVAEFVWSTISAFGGIRRGKTIGKEVDQNLRWLEGGGWDGLFEFVINLKTERTPEAEREAASFVAHHMRGFGPKQSRNFWQWLGLTLWEIPIDSRITKWLNANSFPVHLSAGVLSDPNYYNFVSDGFQMLCKAGGVYPCVLDAAIFASYDAS